jgi:CspA family cold shock protein
MKLGTVKWFNNSKGYGFIRSDEGGEDLFVHYSYIEMDGYKTLKAGQAVSYEETPANKGIHATNIKSLHSESGDSVQESNSQENDSQESNSQKT